MRIVVLLVETESFLCFFAETIFPQCAESIHFLVRYVSRLPRKGNWLVILKAEERKQFYSSQSVTVLIVADTDIIQQLRSKGLVPFCKADFF